MANDIGQGTFVTFGSIVGNAATHYKVNSVSLGGVSRDVVDASHLLTTGGKEFIGSEYYDLWLDSLLKTVRTCDPAWSEDVEKAWENVMGVGISYLCSRYST